LRIGAHLFVFGRTRRVYSRSRRASSMSPRSPDSQAFCGKPDHSPSDNYG
jgi:hypothetical protein